MEDVRRGGASKSSGTAGGLHTHLLREPETRGRGAGPGALPERLTAAIKGALCTPSPGSCARPARQPLVSGC
ncbi:unnamed protein product [Rangifer tarandus platyrhynchus]|uniref:Uncharacterized protein n=2 Tax=Rangifer tarandus platyrhynchus TaxID=3082113 RepID=A0ABN8YDF4_RANTA|nr:unnamed protein product [Rangifer tarandus platyrhynchus]CAI9699946.1 unnamed protein product [Rangifer tarandus platyrhynchus]